MQLRRLDLHGFKTFANPTSLEFSGGVTAVVGPNGSGKSNISDAILWVLGEQNVRNLRGGKLQDVIFAGSATRRPSGMAEVALTFDNLTRRIPLDFSEITVTRRVYRSGESEYFINGTHCRLRDIVDLFMDTGIGRESYFALNQGEIDMILSADPEERRLLFEEAAGIKKYRIRKKESLRKLEVTQANLLRIHDLLGEVETRVGPLERQAEAAKQYRELEKQLRSVELGAFAAAWNRLQESIREQEAQLTQRLDAQMALETHLLQLSAREEETRQQLHLCDSRLEEAHARYQELTTQTAEEESCLSVLRERLESHRSTLRLREQRLEEISSRGDELRKSLEQARESAAELDGVIQQAEQISSTLRLELKFAEENAGAAAAALEAAQSRAVNQAAQLARLEADREASTRRIDGLLEQGEQLGRRAAEIQQSFDALAVRRQELSRSREEASSAAEAVSRRLDGHASDLLSAKREVSRIREVVRSLEEDAAAHSARLLVLQDLEQQREGYFRGVRAVLEAAKRGELTGHYRPVADLLSFDDSHETALQTALGSSDQDIVTVSDAEARDAIAMLKRNGAGRATFLPLELLRDTERRKRPIGNSPGVVAIAADLVHCEEQYRPVVESLLGQIVVCSSLENATLAAHRMSHWARIVTLDGDVITSHGAMTGGSKQQNRGSILGRAGEIRSLQARIDHARSDLETAYLELGEKAAAEDELQDRIQIAERELWTLRSSAAELERDLLRSDESLKRFQKERDALHLEQRQIEQRLESERAKYGPGAVEIAAGESSLGEDLAPLRSLLAAASAERDKLREAISERRAEEAALLERRRSLGAAIQTQSSLLDRLILDRTLMVESCAREAENFGALVTDIEDAEERVASTQPSLAPAREAVNAARSERDGVLVNLQQVGEKIRAVSREQQEAISLAGTLESSSAGLQRELDQIRTILADDYDVVVIRTVDEETIQVPADDETVSSFLSGFPKSEQPERDRQTASRLRRQMRALEPVNLDAIQEAVEVAERVAFLQSQRADVEAAAEDLRAVIRQIDNEARERFEVTFQAVATEFESLFRRMFDGGQTRLVLTDPLDPTESGIEIWAQPPGKKLQNLQLLSGGERSMTAVALLFAMLRVRPVPFCVMDEVDAALDEANINRFTEVLREFAAESQFIVITHNKGTMEASDRLYGVTSAEAGVSRVLSVQLSDVQAAPAPIGLSVPLFTPS